VKKASITTIRVDAIVNPANSFGYMGGGVAFAIKNIGGQMIEEEAIEQAPIQIGEAIITTAGDLVAKNVIHAPTMHEPAEKTDIHKVKCAVQAALEIADNKGMKSIAFPGMGTGVGGVRKEDAAKTMLSAMKEMKFHSIENIYLVDIEDEMIEAFQKALKGKR
jgi:O-acetyl-ADP-ribose deacetylase (regulator of RNase III)